MRKIDYYITASGNDPVKKFINSLSTTQKKKISDVFKLILETEVVSIKLLKKLKSTDNIWEIRVSLDGNIFRFLGFREQNNLIILTNGFAKKTQETPLQEIKLAEKRKQDYLNSKELK